MLCLWDASILSLTAIKFERLKYCLRRKAKYLSMCLQVLSVCWAFVNTGTIWAPNSCAQNVGFPIQTGFAAANGAEEQPGVNREAMALPGRTKPVSHSAFRAGDPPVCQGPRQDTQKKGSHKSGRFTKQSTWYKETSEGSHKNLGGK